MGAEDSNTGVLQQRGGEEGKDNAEGFYPAESPPLEEPLLIRTSGSGRAHLYQFRVSTGASILGEILIQVEYKKTFTQPCYCQGSVTQMNSLPFSDLPDASAQISVWRLKTVT